MNGLELIASLAKRDGIPEPKIVIRHQSQLRNGIGKCILVAYDALGRIIFLVEPTDTDQARKAAKHVYEHYRNHVLLGDPSPNTNCSYAKCNYYWPIRKRPHD